LGAVSSTDYPADSKSAIIGAMSKFTTLIHAYVFVWGVKGKAILCQSMIQKINWRCLGSKWQLTKEGATVVTGN